MKINKEIKKTKNIKTKRAIVSKLDLVLLLILILGCLYSLHYYYPTFSSPLRSSYQNKHFLKMSGKIHVLLSDQKACKATFQGAHLVSGHENRVSLRKIVKADGSVKVKVNSTYYDNQIAVKNMILKDFSYFNKRAFYGKGKLVITYLVLDKNELNPLVEKSFWLEFRFNNKGEIVDCAPFGTLELDDIPRAK